MKDVVLWGFAFRDARKIGFVDKVYIFVKKLFR